MLSKSLPLVICAALLGCRLGEPRSEAGRGHDGGLASAKTPSSSSAPAASANSAPTALAILHSADVATAPSAPPAASVATAPSRSRRVVVLGDSLSDPSVGGGGYFRYLMSACPGVEVESLAKGGFMVNQMRRRFQEELAPRLPGGFDTIIVFGGVNDLYSDESAGRTVEKIQNDLTTIYRASKAAGLRVIALTVAPWGGFSRYYNPRRAEATLRLNAWLRSQITTGLVDVVIDTHPLLLCGDDADRLCPDYQSPFRDGLHFGKVGQERIGRALVEQGFRDCAAAAAGPDR